MHVDQLFQNSEWEKTVSRSNQLNQSIKGDYIAMNQLVWLSIHFYKFNCTVSIQNLGFSYSISISVLVELQYQ